MLEARSEITVKKLLLFGGALALIISSSYLYKDRLNDMSYRIITSLQEGQLSDSPYMEKWDKIGKLTGGKIIMTMPFLACAFLSRERFFYYAVAQQLCEFCNVTRYIL